MTKTAPRLIKGFIPEKYNLKITIDPEALIFTGEVLISGHKKGRPSSRITFHQKDLKIKSASIIHHHKNGPDDVELARTNIHKAYDELRLHSKSVLYPGKYDILISFSGKITEQAHGLYFCSYTEEDVPKILIATQLESHHAREIFPCIDEPEAKAEFDLQLTYPDKYSAISNTLVASETTGETLKTTLFQTTPVMSTYLLALAVGEIACSETKHGDVLIRAFSVPSKVKHTEFALETAKRCLGFYDTYFGISYPLKKLDMIALPDMGGVTLGMENWGLITYRESAMLVDEQNSSLETRMLVGQVVNHEVAHQWFGNLVTMKWWDDLWLNESFAHVMEFIATDSLFPDWDIWHYFNEYELDMAFNRDALLGISPIKSTINHPEEIGVNFDRAIAYAKGAVVLNMLRKYIGDGTFKAALALYFKKHSYGNTSAADLWLAMDEATGSNNDVSDFMAEWINKPGYPVINVEWQPDSNTARLSQNRFSISPNSSHTLWQIPLDSSPGLSKTLLTHKSDNLLLEEPSQTLLLNKDVSGYFLVNYLNPGHREAIKQTLGSQNPSYRSYYIQNLILLDKAGLIETSQLLDVGESLKEDKEPTVWHALNQSMSYLRYMTSKDETTTKLLNKYSQKLLSNIISDIVWQSNPTENIATKKLRSSIIAESIASSNADSINKAVSYFKNDNLDTVSPDIRKFIFEAVSKEGSDKLFEKLLELHNRPDTTAEQREELAFGITKASSLDRINLVLQLLRSQHIKHQDLMSSWLRPLLINVSSRNSAWKWLTDNWPWIVSIYGNDHAFERFPSYAALAFQTKEELTEFDSFFKKHESNLALQKSIVLGRETINNKITWQHRSGETTVNWLSKNS